MRIVDWLLRRPGRAGPEPADWEGDDAYRDLDRERRGEDVDR